QAIATQCKHSVGPPVALKMTPITGPDGLQADGSDVALIDIEAVDEHGERCPTSQQRGDFDIDGPGGWRGGYNSGKINSIHNTQLVWEGGMNRVAVRSRFDGGQIVVRPTSQGLRPASVTLTSRAAKIEDGSIAPLTAVSASRSSR